MEKYKTIHENKVLINPTEDFIENLTDIEKRKLLRLISLEVEQELLRYYVKNNPLPFCLKSQNVLQVNYHTSSILVLLSSLVTVFELSLNVASVVCVSLVSVLDLFTLRLPHPKTTNKSIIANNK